MVVKQLEAVIWDFNGTLIDDLDLVVRSVNTQLEKRELPSLTLAEYRDVFGFPVEDYYRRIGLDFENVSMAELVSDFFEEYAPRLQDCPVHDGVLDVLDMFAKRSVRQFVLSAMEEGMLRGAVKHLGIAGFFEGLYGLEHMEGDSKISRGRQLLIDFAIRPETALMIGDTDHDAEVADALGVSVVLVAQGHQSGERLRKAGCLVLPDVQDLASLAL